MKKSELRRMIKEEVDTNRIKQQIDDWKYKTVVYIFSGGDMWSRSNRLEVDEDNQSIEILGDGYRILYLLKRIIKKVNVKEGKSIQIILNNGQIIIQR